MLQLWDLGDKSLWYDEIVTVRIAEQPTFGQFLEVFQESERQPPLHHLLLHVWIKWFGGDDVAVRVPSALLSVGSTFLLVALGRALGKPRIGVTAGFLLAFNPLLLLFGRMARYYSLALFLGLLSALALVKALKKEEGGGSSFVWWTAYAASAAGAVLTNYASVAFLSAEILFVIVWTLRRAKIPAPGSKLTRSLARALGAHVVLFVPVALWIAYDWNRITGFGRSFREFDVSGWKALALNTLYPFYAFGLGETVFPWEAAGAAGTLAFTLVGVVGLWRIKNFGSFGSLVLLGLFATLAITIVAFQTFVQDLPFVTLPARAIGALPFFILIVANGIESLPKRLAPAAVVLLAVVSAVPAIHYFNESSFHNPIYAVPSREIASLVQANAADGSVIVTDDDSGIDHYLEDSMTAGPSPLLAQDEETLAKLQAARYPEVWLITLGRDGSRAQSPDRVIDWVSQNYRLVSTRGYIPQDPTYSKVKESVQGFSDYRFKITVRVYELSPDSVFAERAGPGNRALPPLR